MKNWTSALGFTKPIQDFVAYAQANNVAPTIYMRSNTPVAGPLQALIDNGTFIRKIIPGT